MHPHSELIERFYRAFAARDAEVMASAYDDAARFSDPVFVDLDAREVRGMWRMLCERGTDLEIVASGIEADDHCGKAHWEARYTFTGTGKRVHNVIDAVFELRDGKILRHVDHFDFWRWSRMALGVPGLLLGWSPFLKRSVRARARRQLDRFLAR